LSSTKPKIARFGYAEKLEYWAVIWGTIIMGVTGLAIWFKIDVTRFLPRWAVDVALTIHYYEAILACLAIVVWHFYHVIFDPDVYPANTACLNGRVSKAWLEEEHAAEFEELEASHSKTPTTENGLLDVDPQRKAPDFQENGQKARVDFTI
jgi:cytochrome b subunit of formate dehydrogenase